LRKKSQKLIGTFKNGVEGAVTGLFLLGPESGG
jgi:hypothetical protein